MKKEIPGHNWDINQGLVITAWSAERIVVDAAPGTGKTAVACARVAYLIDYEGCDPPRIWLISFTRTAVAELRQRIATYMEDPEDAHSICIATLDSHAWSLHSGFDSKASLDGGYDANIEKFLNQLRQDSEVQEYIGTIQHLIIDEAQDIVGIRADLLEEFLNHLDSDCGVTIFSDRAQAIYGFTCDTGLFNGKLETNNETLVERLEKKDIGNSFDHFSLEHIFRTESKGLLRIFSGIRQRVLETTPDVVGKLEDVVSSIKQLADGEAGSEFTDALRDRDDLLILYRRRGEALYASSKLREVNVPHRLRMSGLPVCIHPWLASCLANHVESRLSRQQFSVLWKKLPRCYGDEKTAWEALVRIGGVANELVDMTRLTSILGRARPPAEFCLPDLGSSGPIVGTIHASKGRESSWVSLMIPPQRGSPEVSKLDEEARVVFVGATRARSGLLVGKGKSFWYNKLDSSGRVFCKLKPKMSPRAMVEIGRDGDLGTVEVAGKSRFISQSEVLRAQENLANLEFPLPVRAVLRSRDEWFYSLDAGNFQPSLAFLAKQVNHDLFEIGKKVADSASSRATRPPNEIHYLSIAGIRSLVLPPDSPERENLHYPWCVSGIMLAPVVLGLVPVNFPYQRQYKRRY